MSRDVPCRPLGDRSRRPGPNRVVAALAVGALAAAALAGCSGSGGEGSTSSVSSTGGRLGGNGTDTSGSESQGGSRNGQGLSAATRRELRQIRRRLKPPTRDELLRNEVRLVLTSTNPLGCRPPFVTRRFLEAAYGGHQGCVRSRTPGSVASHVDFKQLQVAGDHATAVVVATGGPNDGERITVSLVRDPHWSVDQLRSNAPVGP